MNRRSLSAESLNSPKISYQPLNSLSSPSKGSDRWKIVCLIIASLNILHGLWMVIAPKHWFYNLPAGVPTFGPLNYHFIRDLGCVFFLLGVGLLFAAYDHSHRLSLFTMNTGFYVLHMLVHVHEIVSGRIRLSMFWTDLPGVYIPALILFILNIFLIKQSQTKGVIKQIRN